MPYTSQSSVQPDFKVTGWSDACETAISVFIDWPRFRTSHLLLRTECKPTNQPGCWAIKILGEYFEPPILIEGQMLRGVDRRLFDKVPARFFQIGKRERCHLSAKRLSEIVSGSEREAGPELWPLLQLDGVREAFLSVCPNLLLKSARHVLVKDVMET